MADAKIQFYSNLSMLLNSGVPILRAISTAGGTVRGKYRKAARRIEEDVRGGLMLADSMDGQRNCFEPFDVEMIRTGEQTGQLSEMLAELSRWHEFRRRNRRTITSGLFLSILILHSAAVLVSIVDHPQFYLGGDELIAFLLGILKVLAIFYIPAAVILGILFLTPKRGPLRCILDVLVMGMPLLGSAVRSLSLSRYSKTFAMTYGAGIPIIKAAEQATNACGNWVMVQRLQGAAAKAREGENMSTGFSRTLDPEFREVWMVGEESGDLDRSAERLAALYADRAEFKFQLVAQWVPRIVYGLVSAYIIYKIFSFYSGIYGGLLRGL